MQGHVTGLDARCRVATGCRRHLCHSIFIIVVFFLVLCASEIRVKGAPTGSALSRSPPLRSCPLGSLSAGLPWLGFDDLRDN